MLGGTAEQAKDSPIIVHRLASRSAAANPWRRFRAKFGFSLKML